MCLLQHAPTRLLLSQVAGVISVIFGVAVSKTTGDWIQVCFFVAALQQIATLVCGVERLHFPHFARCAGTRYFDCRGGCEHRGVIPELHAAIVL